MRAEAKHPAAGALRVRGTGAPFLAGYDVTLEVRQADGTHLPLRGVVSADISIRAQALAEATLVIEIGELELEGVKVGGRDADDDLDHAWGIIANAFGGDWSRAPDEWQAAAATWRDRVMPELSKRAAARAKAGL